MLFDPKWTKTDPFSLEALIAWLETKEPGERYCYNDTGGCLIGQYLQANGISESEYMLGNMFLTTRGVCSLDLRDIGFTATAMPRPHTFGAALKRARAIK